MSSLRFLCHFCGGPLKLTGSTETLGLDLSREPAASKSPPAQGEPGGAPEGGSAFRMETDLEELQESAAGWTFPSEDEVFGSDPRNFTLLGKLDPAGTLSSIQRAAVLVFDILTGEELGQPLCEDCTDSLLEQLDSQLRVSGSDIQNYKRCLETRGGFGEDARETLEQELKAAELEEARLAQGLEEVEKSGERARVALEAARAETETLEQQEGQYYRDLSELRRQQLELQDELCSAEARLLHAQAQLSRLESTDAFQVAFAICCDGPVAAINGFRLGCLPTVPVSWREISAAWGQAALLLQALAATAGLRFQRYRLRPCGGRSYLWRLTPGPSPAAALPLFRACGPGAPPEGRFDEAMAAFLDCAQQFHEAAARAEPPLCAPYAVLAGAGLMGDLGASEFYSIRTRRNTEEQWTAALKCMLTNFKCSLAWVSLRRRHR